MWDNFVDQPDVGVGWPTESTALFIGPSLSTTAFRNRNVSSADRGQIGNFPHVLYNDGITYTTGVQNAGHSLTHNQLSL
jgi:hypothetical protein